MLIPSFSAFDPRRKSGRGNTGRSPLRHSGLAHALVHTLSSGEISRIVTRHAGSEPTDSVSGIEGEARLCSSARLAELAGQRQGGGEKEMATCEIAVGVQY
jgi:hypothetical protein